MVVSKSRVAVVLQVKRRRYGVVTQEENRHDRKTNGSQHCVTEPTSSFRVFEMR